MKKRHVVLSAALVAMLALTGCGQDQSKPEEAKAMTAEEVIAASNEAMNDLDSYGFTMDTNILVDMKENGFFMCDMDIFVPFLSNNNFVFNRFQITYKRSKRGLYIM